MGPFDWLAAQNEGVVIVVILLAVIGLVIGLPFVVTGTCHYVDRGVRLAVECCRSLWMKYRAVADQDMVAMEKGEHQPQQASPAAAPLPMQAIPTNPPLPAFFWPEPEEVMAQAQVFVPLEAPCIQPLPPVFIPAEVQELFGEPRTPPPQLVPSPSPPAPVLRPDQYYFGYSSAS